MGKFTSQFKGTGERILQNFNFLDLSRGVAIETLYAMQHRSTASATLGYGLSSKLFRSAEDSVSATIASGSTNVTYDFDMYIEIPRAIQGDCYVNLNFGWTSSGTGVSKTSYVTAYIKKVSTATTTLGTAKSAQLGTVSTQNLNRSETLYFNLAKTHFASGDYLRLSVTVYGAVTAAMSATFYLGTSPTGETTTGLTDSELFVYMPFKVNL